MRKFRFLYKNFDVIFVYQDGIEYTFIDRVCQNKGLTRDSYFHRAK